MKVLFFNPEQYVDFEDEPSNYQLRLPVLNCGLPIEQLDHIYQRDLKDGDINRMNQNALTAVSEFRPDVVIYSSTWPQENLAPSTLAQIRQAGIPVIFIAWDSSLIPDPHEMEFFANVDCYVVYDSIKSYLRFKLLAEWQNTPNKVAFAVGQVYSDHFKARAVEKKYDVTLVGSGEGMRNDLIHYLADNLPALGINFQKMGGLVNDNEVSERTPSNWVSWDDYVTIINQSKICLSSQTQLHRHQLKGKVFDYQACGTMCLSDDSPEMRLLIPDETIVYYSNPADCLEKIRYYVEHEEERRKIEQNAESWLTKTFNYKDFWSSLLNSVVLNKEELPSLAILKEEFARISKSQNALSWAQLKMADTLTEFSENGQKPEKLPVELIGSKNDYRVLKIGEGILVATCARFTDYFQIDGTNYAINPGGRKFPLTTNSIVELSGQVFIIDTELHNIISGIEKVTDGKVAKVKDEITITKIYD